MLFLLVISDNLFTNLNGTRLRIAFDFLYYLYFDPTFITYILVFWFLFEACFMVLILL